MAGAVRHNAIMSMRTLLRGLPVFDRPLPGFDPDTAPHTPMDLFADWLAAAIEAGVPEPQAMTVSTVDVDGMPDARVLSLKDVDADGWQFATSSSSAKGVQLKTCRQAALSLYWKEQARQVRVRGMVTEADPATSIKDFRARPDASRVAALVGRQSAVMTDPAALARESEAAWQRLRDEPDALATDHTVYVVRAVAVEFWQGDSDRQHVRLRYRLDNGVWVRERLWP
jgi:pyridoxamine 5'-phosphate oxidase